MKTLRSLKTLSFASAFILVIGASSFASAAGNSGKTALQATATAAATATPIDPSIAIPLTFGTASSSPLDNADVNYRKFTFKGKANELVTITTSILTGNMGTETDVTSQSGSDLVDAHGAFVTTSALTVKLPQDGNYQIRVSSDNPGSGDFAAGTISVLVNEATVPSAAPVVPTSAATMAATASK